MSHPLEALMALQKKDLKLIRVLREIKDIPVRKKDIEKQLYAAQIKLNTSIDNRKLSEASLGDIENETELLKEKINKYKQQQMEADTNEQYRAFVKEIGSVESEVKSLEEKALNLMESLEDGRKIEEECNIELEKEKNAISEEVQNLDNRYQDLQERFNQMKEDRKKDAINCDPSLLKKYTRILSNKKDAAVVLVESGCHCGGCHMKLPPQVINDAKNINKIVCCNFCGRIVYNPS